MDGSANSDALSALYGLFDCLLACLLSVCLSACVVSLTSLLSCCVPDLELHNEVVQLNGLGKESGTTSRQIQIQIRHGSSDRRVSSVAGRSNSGGVGRARTVSAWIG